jgi:hypothetical protein
MNERTTPLSLLIVFSADTTMVPQRPIASNHKSEWLVCVVFSIYPSSWIRGLGAPPLRYPVRHLVHQNIRGSSGQNEIGRQRRSDVTLVTRFGVGPGRRRY